jgi:hypothetical protein
LTTQQCGHKRRNANKEFAGCAAYFPIALQKIDKEMGK